jgi:hypothetical protein
MSLKKEHTSLKVKAGVFAFALTMTGFQFVDFLMKTSSEHHNKVTTESLKYLNTELVEMTFRSSLSSFCPIFEQTRQLRQYLHCIHWAA